MLTLAEQRIDALFAVLVAAALLMLALRFAMRVAERRVARADAEAMRHAASTREPDQTGSGPPSDPG